MGCCFGKNEPSKEKAVEVMENSTSHASTNSVATASLSNSKNDITNEKVRLNSGHTDSASRTLPQSASITPVDVGRKKSLEPDTDSTLFPSSPSVIQSDLVDEAVPNPLILKNENSTSSPGLPHNTEHNSEDIVCSSVETNIAQVKPASCTQGPTEPNAINSTREHSTVQMSANIDRNAHSSPVEQMLAEESTVKQEFTATRGVDSHVKNFTVEPTDKAISSSVESTQSDIAKIEESVTNQAGDVTTDQTLYGAQVNTEIVPEKNIAAQQPIDTQQKQPSVTDMATSLLEPEAMTTRNSEQQTRTNIPFDSSPHQKASRCSTNTPSQVVGDCNRIEYSRANVVRSARSMSSDSTSSTSVDQGGSNHEADRLRHFQRLGAAAVVGGSPGGGPGRGEGGIGLGQKQSSLTLGRGGRGRPRGGRGSAVAAVPSAAVPNVASAAATASSTDNDYDQMYPATPSLLAAGITNRTSFGPHSGPLRASGDFSVGIQQSHLAPALYETSFPTHNSNSSQEHRLCSSAAVPFVGSNHVDPTRPTLQTEGTSVETAAVAANTDSNIHYSNGTSTRDPILGRLSETGDDDDGDEDGTVAVCAATTIDISNSDTTAVVSVVTQENGDNDTADRVGGNNSEENDNTAVEEGRPSIGGKKRRKSAKRKSKK